MTNLEMHKDLILNLVHTKHKECLSPFGYAVASFCGSYDWEVMLKWLFSEYEPTLLENGDGLQPDDWVMVRDKDSEPWLKRRFLVYRNGLFYCVDGGFGINKSFYVYGWRQARLPMEGE